MIESIDWQQEERRHLNDEKKNQYSLTELADYLGAELRGDPNDQIDHIATIQSASRGALTFLASNAYVKYLAETGATAVILSEEHANNCKASTFIVKNPYLSYAKVSALFAYTSRDECVGVHESAVIADSVVLGENVSIGPQVVIESGVCIGADVTIGAGCFIGHDTVIGNNSKLNVNVTVCCGVAIGKNVVLRSGAVIGEDGFGFAYDQAWVKIHQLGGVVIGNNVDIGANTCIDRGALDDTIIHDGVILDNHIQIGHNVIIGKNSALAGCVGIAGSTRIGERCTIGGGSCISGHIELTSDVHIAGFAFVTTSLKKPGHYSPGSLGCMPLRSWKKNIVRFRHLEKMSKRLVALEKKLN